MVATAPGQAPDTYRVRVQAPDYETEFYDDVATLEQADGVLLVAGQTTSIEVQLTPSDHIAGTVSDQDGSPLEGVVVHVTGTSEYTGVTDAAGHYDIGPLSEARYFVWATDTYHQTPDGVWVELPDDPSAQVDFEMLPAGALSCRISGAGGGAIPFAGMTLLKNYDGVWLDQYGASVRWPNPMVATAPGQAPDTYRVRVQAPDYETEFYDDVATLEQADGVLLVAGQTTSIEVQLTPSDHIAGTVSDQDGSPLEGVVVHVTGTSEYTGVTDAAGHYDIGPLSEARYFVWATDTYHQTPDGVWVELPDDPSAQVDFEMLPAGALSCRISGAGGGAIPFAGMTLLKNYDGVWLDQYGASVRWPNPMVATAPGQAPDTYRVRVQAPDYETEFYDDVATLEQADGVLLVAGQTTSIEVQLTPSDHIAGTVSDQDGSPLEGVVVHVTGTSEYTGVTDAAGHYDIGPLSEARYFVWATDTYHQTPDGVWVELPDDPSAQVDFEMLPPNHPPVLSDQATNTTEDTAVVVILAGLDADIDPLTFRVLTDPRHGTLSGTAPVDATSASVTYTPAADYNGPDSFTYRASDGELDSESATVSITVTAVNDAPVADAAGPYSIDGSSGPQSRRLDEPRSGRYG